MDEVRALLAAQNAVSKHYVRQVGMAVELGTGDVKKTRQTMKVAI